MLDRTSDDFKIVLPRRKIGRPSAIAAIQYGEDLQAFCEAIREFRSPIGFREASECSRLGLPVGGR
jgi:hypothetical protein